MGYGTDEPEASYRYPDSTLVAKMKLIGLTRRTGAYLTCLCHLG